MSATLNKFYNIFWQNKACQNLFLLSKEELLDTIEIKLDNNNFNISMPRIILSNVKNKDDFEYKTLKLRNEDDNLQTQENLELKIKLFEPLLENFIESNFGKSLQKVVVDIEENPEKFIKRFFRLIFKSSKKQEKEIITILQDYGFIGRNINSLREIGEQFDNSISSKKNLKPIINEKNTWNILEFAKSIKDIYVNETKKSLYNSNQVLLGALHENEDYKSRKQLFSHLYDSKVILPSNEDAFIECLDCETGTYRGSMQIKINPKKLNNLKCPLCTSELSYYIPYELNKEIYHIINEKDGLLQNVAIKTLENNNINYRCNLNYDNDIEIDIKFQRNGITYFVECKMYKLNTSNEKLISKIKKHFRKSLEDTHRINEQNKSTILLINAQNDEIIEQVINTFEINENDKILNPKILNFNQFENLITSNKELR